MPTQVLALLAEITGTLTENFPAYPPHTIQRLAELVLYPKQHYKSVAAYLHAVDRVVHVTSGNNIYPLPPAIPDMSNMSISSNGVAGDNKEADEASAALTINTNGAAIGSDEALGGALLTPIPWLQRTHMNGGEGSSPASSSPIGSEDSGSHLPPGQGSTQQSQGPGQGSGSSASRHLEGQVRTESTETIEGPNGMGSIETVSVSVNGIPSIGARALTQGEILRQEQRAGVVPVSQLTRANALNVMGPSPFPSAAPISGESDPPNSPEADPVGESESADDTATVSHSENPDDEMADEVPHARGPEEIGAADMGPQSQTSSNISITSDGNVEMHGIDVESAVGRKADPQPYPTSAERSRPEQAKSENEEMDNDEKKGVLPESSVGEEEQKSPEIPDIQPSTPTAFTGLSNPAKRTAEDEDMDAETPSKKRQKSEDDGEAAAVGDETKATEPAAETSAATAEDAPELIKQEESEGKEQETEKPKQDSEGDIVLSDQATDPPPAPPPPPPSTADADAEAKTVEGDDKDWIKVDPEDADDDKTADTEKFADEVTDST